MALWGVRLGPTRRIILWTKYFGRAALKRHFAVHHQILLRRIVQPDDTGLDMLICPSPDELRAEVGRYMDYLTLFTPICRKQEPLCRLCSNLHLLLLEHGCSCAVVLGFQCNYCAPMDIAEWIIDTIVTLSSLIYSLLLDCSNRHMLPAKASWFFVHQLAPERQSM